MFFGVDMVNFMRRISIIFGNATVFAAASRTLIDLLP